MVPVVVIGAGPAGLATAACLLRHGVRPLVLDRGEYVGQSWAERYDRLHLHTPRIQSHLPGLRLPRSYGRWVARDDFVRYLQRYAAHHGIEVRFGVEVDAVRPAPGGHRVTGAGVDVTARHVVLATGFNRVPVVPEWPGAGSFTGSLVHSSAYRDATPYRGRDVLVAGIGNSGAEIAADLAESGAGRVRIAVRTPPHVVTRQVGPLPTTLIGIAQAYLPAWLVDPGSARLARAVVGDLSAYGLPTPQEGVAARMRRLGSVPLIDVGLVDQLRAGRVEVVAAIAAFDGAAVELVDGSCLRPDAVIAATGYVDGLAAFVDAGPATPVGRRALDRRRAPGLFAVGLLNTPQGVLFRINLDARRVARVIAGQERRPSTRPGARRRR